MGTEFRTNVHALHRNSLIGLVVAVVLLFYGSFGLAGNGIYLMEQIWNLPGVERVNFLKRMGRSAEFILLLGAGLVVTTCLNRLSHQHSVQATLRRRGCPFGHACRRVRAVRPWLTGC